MPIYDRGNLISSADGYKSIEKANQDVKYIKYMTQVQYDALKIKDKNTMYLIVSA